MLDNIVKIKIDNNKMDIIDNFGIYDFLDSSDNHVKLNMISLLSGNNYVITTGYAHKFSHADLKNKINDLIDDYSVSISSFGDRIVIVGNDVMNESDYYVIYGVLKEIEEYTKNTSIQKSVSVDAGGLYGNYFSNYNVNNLIARVLDRIYNVESAEKIKKKKDTRNN